MKLENDTLVVGENLFLVFVQTPHSVQQLTQILTKSETLGICSWLTSGHKLWNRDWRLNVWKLLLLLLDTTLLTLGGVRWLKKSTHPVAGEWVTNSATVGIRIIVHWTACVLAHLWFIKPLSAQMMAKKTILDWQSGTFKVRYNNHMTNFRHEKYSNSTELSKYIWGLKRSSIDYKVEWSIWKKAPAYSPASKSCGCA